MRVRELLRLRQHNNDTRAGGFHRRLNRFDRFGNIYPSLRSFSSPSLRSFSSSSPRSFSSPSPRSFSSPSPSPSPSPILSPILSPFHRSHPPPIRAGAAFQPSTSPIRPIPVRLGTVKARPNTKVVPSKVEQAVDILSARVLCPVCLDDPPNTACIPCGHLLCELCAAKVVALEYTCCTCRKEIENTVRIWPEGIQRLI